MEQEDAEAQSQSEDQRSGKMQFSVASEHPSSLHLCALLRTPVQSCISRQLLAKPAHSQALTTVTGRLTRSLQAVTPSTNDKEIIQ